jgi:predicted nucleic acid-binding protein
MAKLKVFDTNAMIAVSQGMLIVDPLQVRVAVSVVTRIELLSWPALSVSGRAELRRMLSSVDVIEISQQIEDLAIDVRVTHRLKLPDAIIAATALGLSAPLVTNDQLFGRVPGLVIESL